MEDADDIDVEIVEPEEIEQDETQTPRQKGVGLLPVIILSSFAAIIGTIGGAYGAQYFVKAPDASSINSQISLQTADIEDKTQNSITALKAELDVLKTDLMEVQGGQASEQVLASLQNRLETLETAPSPDIPEIDSEVLSALKNAQAEGFNWPDMTEIEASLDRLEQDYTALSERTQEISEALETAIQIPANVMPLDASEPSQAITINQTVTLPDFPEMALRKAAQDAVKQKGFLARTLSKHIDVRQPDDPIVLIEKTATAIKSGDLDVAIKTFDQLPDSIKSAGQAWRDAAAQY